MPATFELAQAYVTVRTKLALKEDTKKNASIMKDAMAKLAVDLSVPANKAFERMKMMNETIGKMVNGMKELGHYGTVAFVGGTAAITGLVASGAPQAIETLTGSFRLLSGELGAGFLPIIVKVSTWLQKMAAIVRDMDDETKEGYAKWIAYGVAIAGILMVLGKVITTVKTLWMAYEGLKVAIASATTAQLAFGASLTVAALAAADLAVNIAKVNMEMAETVHRAKEAARGVVTKEDVKSPINQQLNAMKSDKERLAAIEAEYMEAEKEFKKSSEEYAQKSTAGKAWNMYFGGGAGAKAEADMNRLIRARALLEQMRKSGGERVTKSTEEEAAMRYRTAPVAITGIAEARHRVMTAALQQDPIGAKQLEQAIRMNTLMEKAVQDLDKMAQNDDPPIVGQ